MTRRISRNAVLCLVLLALSAVAPVYARVERATVIVEGMACPFCAFGVEKRLKKVEGVGTIEVSMGEGSASMSASEEGSIDVTSLPGAIRKAGFTPGTIEVTAVGRISAEDGERSLLEVSGTDQKLLLVNLSEEIDEKVAEFSAAGVSVRVSGALHVHPEELAGLQAVTIEAVE
jgi:mercuric ion binding protein